MSMFQRAQRDRVVMKVAVVGASGSGKTFSALRLATGLGGKIAVLDTENRRANFYADRFQFDACDLRAPFTVEAYRRVIQGAEAAGYSILIIDSLSHAWAGTGGLLEKKDQLDRRSGGGNQFSNWQPITQEQEALKAAILESPLHIIATMRAKADYVLEQINGKSVPRKVGMAAIQRDGIEYEFAIVFKLGADTVAVADKDNTSLFFNHNAQLTEEHGQAIARWLDSGAEPLPAPTLPTPREILQPAATMPAERATMPTTAPQAAGAMICTLPPCCTPLTKGQYEVSLKAYGRPLCPKCQKKIARGEVEAPPQAAPAPNPNSAEQQERWRRLKQEADALDVSVEPFRPTADTAPADVDALLTGLETLIGEVREGIAQEKAEVAA